ncbi:FAD-dependent monooxygenase [Halobacillus locisalis]|uniref:FAD-dependent monooxygenase n=1 Tax=Halobacillus locisalis TaxID=220753 RepID=A0A838CVU3_9BACI|nr:FAD-dependent monooxygenase [Halobacillus locisalis]MBA2175875.1 FAD-dependent monooxygenase [Halobacillus locisalis]
MTSAIETDVLIIGAGPTGLMAANELQKRGLDFVCLEKNAAPSDLSKALGIQARTLELFELLGVHRPFLKKGYPGPGAKLHLGGDSPSLVELYHIESRYPYMLVLPQSETEEILEDHLSTLGGKVHRKHDVVDINETDEGVRVEAKHDGEIITYEAKYLLACDGAHSPVREALNVEFVGEDDGYTFFLGDVDVPALNDIYINMHLNDRGDVAFFPYKDGSYRVVGLDRSKQGLPHKDELPLHELQESINTIMSEPYKVENPKWLSYFGTSHRQVPNYRKGNVFFVGDAAHIHNPMGGQGMNLGLQDVANIAWKLEAVLKGYAGDAFLDSYHEERWPLGKDVLKETSRMLKIANLEGTPGKIRNWAGKAVLTQDWVQDRIANHLSNIYNEYEDTPRNKSLRDSSLPKGAIQAGQRVPDHLLFFDGTTDESIYPLIRKHGHLCLVYIDSEDEAFLDRACSFSDKLNEAYPDLMKVVLVAKGGTVSDNRGEHSIIYDVHRHLEKKLGMRKGHTLLVRPDGHVAFHESSSDIEKTLDKVKRFFS